MAQGKNTIVATSDDTVMSGNGTSFSSPVTAGMLACLWGSNPKKSNFEIMNAVIESCDRYLNPDEQFGYGIPNYFKVHELFAQELIINLETQMYNDIEYNIFTIDGRLVDKGVFITMHPRNFLFIPKPKSAGVYIINYSSNNIQISKKFIVFD